MMEHQKVTNQSNLKFVHPNLSPGYINRFFFFGIIFRFPR